MIERLTIIGLGLIGGSLARALKRAQWAAEITGFDTNEDTLAFALKASIIDRQARDLGDACRNADLIVVAVNLHVFELVVSGVAAVLPEHAVVTDVGSVKCAVNEIAGRVLGGKCSRFVGGHPIAGTEQSGIEYSFAELFDRHRVILTPGAETDEDARALVESMWRAAGASEVVVMEDRHHDEVLAATSHVPHVLSYALVECLAELEDRREIFKYAAGGFADFTRIASSNPEMWHDITMANREAILEVLVKYEQTARQIADALASGDSERLRQLYYRAKATRDAFVDERKT